MKLPVTLPSATGNLPTILPRSCSSYSTNPPDGGDGPGAPSNARASFIVGMRLLRSTRRCSASYARDAEIEFRFCARIRCPIPKPTVLPLDSPEARRAPECHQVENPEGQRLFAGS